MKVFDIGTYQTANEIWNPNNYNGSYNFIFPSFCLLITKNEAPHWSVASLPSAFQVFGKYLSHPPTLYAITNKRQTIHCLSSVTCE